MRKIFFPENLTKVLRFVSWVTILLNIIVNIKNPISNQLQITDGYLSVTEVENAEPEFKENRKVSFSHQLTLWRY